MKINIYRSQKEIEKSYSVDNYDLMFGTIEDVLAIFDEIEDISNNIELFKAIQANRSKLYDLLKDIFPELTDDELRRVKLKELVPVFMELFAFVMKSIGAEKN